MTISKCNKDDLRDILALQKLSYQSEAEIYNDYRIPPLTQTIDDLENEFNSTVILKAVIDRRIVGSVRAGLDDSECSIGKLIVHPEYQNRGIGSSLLNEIERVYIEKGIKKFSLFTGNKSLKNLALYKKRGYRVFKIEEINSDLSFVFLEKHI